MAAKALRWEGVKSGGSKGRKACAQCVVVLCAAKANKAAKASKRKASAVQSAKREEA